MSSRAKRFAVMALAVVLALALALGVAPIFGGTRNAYAATDVLTLDFDGTQAKIDETNAAGAAEGDANGVFTGTPATGYTAWSKEIAHEGTLTIELGEAITAADYSTVNISMVVGNWTGGTTTTTGYAADDTDFSDPAGSVDTPMGNSLATLTLDVAKLADADGKVQSIVLRRTETETSTTGQYFFDYVQFVPAPEPQETLTVDFDGTQVTMDVKSGVDADNLFGVFAGNDGSTKLAYTSDAVAIDGTIKMTLATPVSAADYPAMRIRMVVGNRVDEVFDGSVITTAYAADDTAFETPVGSVSTRSVGNNETALELETAALANEEGYVESFVLRRTGDMDGQYFFDYLYFYTPADDYSSKHLQAGDYVAESNPAGIEDDNVTWLTLRKYTVDVPPYTTVDSVALGDLRTWKDDGGTIDATLPDAPIFGGEPGDATCGVRANKIVWALDVGNLIAENYAQFSMTFFFTDWLFGQHQFYLYGSGTTAFTNAEGEPAGYAAELTVSGPQTEQTITLNDEDVASLADAMGNINYIYIVWWGNTADTATDIAGTYNGTQLYVNEVNFLIDEDVERPTESGEYIEKDLSELLPVGDGASFDLKTSGIQTGEEGYGSYTTVASAEAAENYDAVEFTVTPTYTENFSFYIVFKAPGADTTYETGGVTLWVASDNTLIGASSGEGGYATVAQKFATDYNGAFASGQPTKVRMEMIPGYLEGVQSGYFLYVYLNDGEEAFLSGYIENADVSLGDYINIVYQDLGSDYSVVFGSASDTPTAAADVMEVTVSTNSGSTEFTTPRAKLNLDHMQVEGEQVSDLIIEGDATYNAENGFLTFNSNGTVKVHYTVTNAFGTFTSNTLELTYTGAGGTDGGDDNGGGLTTGAIVGIVVAAVVVVAAAIAIPAVIVRKKKNAK